MRFGKIQRNSIPFLHSAPCGVHHINAAVLVVGGDHQDRHREDAFCDFELLSHDCFLFSAIGLTGTDVLPIIISGNGNKTSTDIQVRYYHWRKRIMIKNYIENANFKDTGFSYTLSLISGKHKMVILYCLMEFEPVRFNELRRYMKNISDKTLSANLKELEADHLIIRKEYPQIPPKVEYSLSERGRSLMVVLDQLCVWGEENKEKVGVYDEADIE